MDYCEVTLQRRFDIPTPSAEEMEAFALLDIDQRRQPFDKMLADFQLSTPTFRTTYFERHCIKLIHEELAYDRQALQNRIARHGPMLNEEQA